MKVAWISSLMALLTAFPHYLGAEILLSNCFTDHMVLQREMPVMIRGKASPGEAISVAFRKQVATTEVDEDGEWVVFLKPLSAGGPDDLTLSGEKDSVVIHDVLVGDVWLGSGQSNMEYPAKAKDFAEDRILADHVANGPYPHLRLLHSKRDGWELATPDNLENFSALLFSFGLRVQPEIGVPVGLMVGARGGSPAGLWVTEKMLRDDAECSRRLAELKRLYTPEKVQALNDKNLKHWEQWIANIKSKGGTNFPQKPDAVVPCDFSNRIISQEKVGGLFEKHLRQWVGYGLKGVLWDQGESGTGLIELPEQYHVMGALIHGWRKKWNIGAFPFIYVQKPSGSGCAFDPKDPVTQFARPFEQLNEGRANNHRGEEIISYIHLMDYPNTWMAETVDLGSAGHPPNKSGYGLRAGNVALNIVYGQKDIPWIGPQYDSHRIEGNKVLIEMKNAGPGLVWRHGDKLQGFSITENGHHYYWAQARIVDEHTVEVWHPEIEKPTVVRYAWHPWHPWANLFSKNGLAALTFQTDDWLTKINAISVP